MEEFTYRVLFVKFERDKYGIVNVTNDGWHKGSFISEAATKKEFEEDCEAYMDTDEFAKAMKVTH